MCVDREILWLFSGHLCSHLHVSFLSLFNCPDQGLIAAEGVPPSLDEAVTLRSLFRVNEYCGVRILGIEQKEQKASSYGLDIPPFRCITFELEAKVIVLLSLLRPCQCWQHSQNAPFALFCHLFLLFDSFLVTQVLSGLSRKPRCLQRCIPCIDVRCRHLDDIQKPGKFSGVLKNARNVTFHKTRCLWTLVFGRNNTLGYWFRFSTTPSRLVQPVLRRTQRRELCKPLSLLRVWSVLPLCSFPPNREEFQENSPMVTVATVATAEPFTVLGTMYIHVCVSGDATLSLPIPVNSATSCSSWTGTKILYHDSGRVVCQESLTLCIDSCMEGTYKYDRNTMNKIQFCCHGQN